MGRAGLGQDAATGTAGVLGVMLVVAALRAAMRETNPTVAALLLLLVVVAVATTARLRIAVALSIFAMLAFNFFFLPPFYAFTIADPKNWVALFVFMAVSGIACQLAAYARARATDAEARRQQAEVFAQRAELASALLASFSHDLRTPLTALQVAVANLESGEWSDADRRIQAQLARGEIDRLNRLFQDILDMARIDTAAIAPDRQWVTAAEIVEAAVAYAGPAAAARHLRIDADSSTAAQVDPRLTSSAFAHLLENAAKYSPPERPIDLAGWVDAEGLHLDIRDYGPGLGVNATERIFEPFYRADTAQRQSAGTGMGLAITRGLLIVQGGRVDAGNAIGGGARFTIVIPAASRTMASPA